MRIATRRDPANRAMWRAPAPALPARRRHAGPASASPRVEAKAAARATTAQRHRASGGPEDEATYSCSCGVVFEARVSTTVACPHCGTGQAW